MIILLGFSGDKAEQIFGHVKTTVILGGRGKRDLKTEKRERFSSSYSSSPPVYHQLRDECAGTASRFHL
jgi:hypothetical protein